MCVLQSFERNVSAAPDALAIAAESRQITYRELNSTADRIAEGLCVAGVGDGDMVGVLADRSPHMIAALLGVWKAGGAYMPLDPAAPVERTAFMLQDAAPQFVLTQRKFISQISASSARPLDLDQLCISENPSRRATLLSKDSLAYVIYTSGSTGRPKGARISHGALANTLRGVGQDLQLQTEDLVLAWSTIAFDVACLEIFLPLALGASLFLVDEGSAGAPRAEQITRSGATVMFGTPTMYRRLLEQGWRGGARMQAVVGGEALPLSLGIHLARKCRAVWNQYGPTEAAICATRARIDGSTDKITIGRPLPHVSIHLLDPQLQPVPRGTAGEMYIGGAGVGLGYLHRDDLSRARFLPDPFNHDGKGRLYKSGDLAVELPDGSFDFLGRVDDQVKIRGYRIELGEIESALRLCDGVQAAVVRAIDFGAGDRRLIAFVAGRDALVSQWEQSLRRTLPVYMVPAEFVPLRCFPTTASGKVDVQALDAMRLQAAMSEPAPDVDFIDPMEDRLKAIWKRLLKLNTVGLDQDFFALGGHSLLAERMLVQVEGWFGSRLPHSVLVEHPTIRKLAGYLRQNPSERWPLIVSLQAGGELTPLFIAHGIGGSVLSFRDLAQELGREQPVYGLQLPAYIGEHQDQVRQLAASYVRQVRAIQPSGPYHLAGHSSGGVIVFEMACQLRDEGESVGLLALLDCDPDTGKHMHHAFDDWTSIKASVRRAIAELTVREFGLKELIHRRVVYQRIKIRAWRASRSRRTGKTAGNRPLDAEGYLALAMGEHELSIYRGDVVLFSARDEPGGNPEPARSWAGKIFGACETHFIPGTHRGILNRPFVISLAREIKQRLTGEQQSCVTSVVA
jgi:amino acid adenylation domain-containing protein